MRDSGKGGVATRRALARVDVRQIRPGHGSKSIHDLHDDEALASRDRFLPLPFLGWCPTIEACSMRPRVLAAFHVLYCADASRPASKSCFSRSVSFSLIAVESTLEVTLREASRRPWKRLAKPARSWSPRPPESSSLQVERETRWVSMEPRKSRDFSWGAWRVQPRELHSHIKIVVGLRAEVEVGGVGAQGVAVRLAVELGQLQIHVTPRHKRIDEPERKLQLCRLLELWIRGGGRAVRRGACGGVAGSGCECGGAPAAPGAPSGPARTSAAPRAGAYTAAAVGREGGETGR